MIVIMIKMITRMIIWNYIMIIMRMMMSMILMWVRKSLKLFLLTILPLPENLQVKKLDQLNVLKMVRIKMNRVNFWRIGGLPMKMKTEEIKVRICIKWRQFYYSARNVHWTSWVWRWRWSGNKEHYKYTKHVQ